MTEDEKRKKRSERMQNYAVILLIFLVLLPSTICIILAVQVSGLRKDVRTLQNDAQAWMQQSTQITSTDSTLEDNSNLSEEDITADIIALENKVVWSEEEQNAKGWDSKSGIRRVYLTFDDGPSSNTDKILDILNEYGVKATFFVCGNEKYTEEYQRIVEEGHTLGMHSYSHKFREIYQSPEAFKTDMNMLHDYLYEVTGVDSKFIRFPGGSSNTICETEVMQELIDNFEQEEIIYFDWNVSSGDASSSYVSAQQIARNVLDNVERFNTVIVLMHDAQSKSTTVEALPVIIEGILKAENTVLLPITEETIPIQHARK